PVLSMLVAACVFFGLILVAEALFRVLGPAAHAVVTRLSFAGILVVLLHPLVWWIVLSFVPALPGVMIFVVCAVVPWTVGTLSLWSKPAGWLAGTGRSELRRVWRAQLGRGA
ncbi:MAG TPA: hypothetical protein VFQ96_02610, partial [Microbacteriaceae bacterium]|nr:hypothetical protein [Microbacteriaceae bacterium]